MNPNEQFIKERNHDINEMAKDEELKKLSLEWMIKADKYKYTYNYSWMGRPIIKFPNDMVLMQEIIWDIQPDLIIEAGIAHGGSIIFYASMMEMMGINDGEVLGIDIDIRSHNREKIEKHPMFKRITMIEGSSIDSKTIEYVQKFVSKKKKIIVVLDSLHTHDHVLEELRLYHKFVALNSYLILPDTFIEYFPKGFYNNRPWDVGNNPMTAMIEFMKENDDFIIDRERANKLMITEAFDGYLKRIK